MNNYIDYDKLFNFSVKNKLPMVRQSTIAECGLACLTMISIFHGHNVDLRSMRLRFSIDNRGINLSTLMDMCHSMGLLSRPVKLDLSNIKKLKMPCILHWDLNHFVVLSKVTRNFIIVNDPAKGVVKLSFDEVSKHFTGIALELTKSENFIVFNEKKKIRVFDVLGKIRGLGKSFLTVVFISFLLELFSIVNPFYMQWVIDQVIVSADSALLTLLSLIFLSVAIVNPVLNSFRDWCITRISSLIHIQWTQNVVTHLFKLPMVWFETRSVGDVTSRIGSVGSIKDIITSNIISAILDGFMSFIMMVVMTFYSLKMTLFMVVFIFIYWLLRVFFIKKIQKQKEAILESKAIQDSEIIETVRGMLTIKVTGIVRERLSRYINKSVESSNKELIYYRTGILFSMLSHLLFGLCNIFIVWYGAYITINNEFTAGALIAFLSFSNMLGGRASSFIDKIIEVKLINVYSERISDITLSSPIEKNKNNITVSCISGNGVVLNNITFGYNNKMVLNNLSVDIKSGHSIAIVGPSGCGKTTLAKIILGLFKPQKGMVLFGGVNIDKLDNDDYNSVIGAVMQDDQLFAGSILDNIVLFSNDINIDLVVSVSKAAFIHDDIMSMPMNYHTLVGDMGSSLSGGQKQRILIARALYRKPRLLIMDEATSHLDIDTEKAINNIISKMNITRIIIAHRNETINMADYVFEMK
ncbi:TPA: peptidase domain-containing ABC transporter [Salmonella enterica]|nr:peptidase domain-containing ABC transporter [Salmonella enterica]